MEEERLQVVVERFCRCNGKHHVKKECHKWKPVQNATKAQFRAFEKLITYLDKYNPEVWSGDIVMMDYAKYRVRMIQDGK